MRRISKLAMIIAGTAGLTGTPPMVPTAKAQVNSLADCIAPQRDGNTIVFRNVCNDTLHFDFQITNSCNSGPTGGFTFSAGYGPVNLMESDCTYEYWVCTMEDWNDRGGSCH